MFHWISLVLLVAYTLVVSEENGPTPVVLWHGMGDSCCNPLSMGRIKRMIEEQIPGIYVKSIQIGSTFAEDTLNGFKMPISDQILEACEEVKADVNLPNGVFNAIGFSQGGQFLRALVEQCDGLAVHNLISIGGQHQGVYGLPNCPGETVEACNTIRETLTVGAYVPFIQKHLVQAEYWHDPLNEQEYESGNIWLPVVNNDKEINQEYKQRMLNLNNFVMVMFNNDTVVEPVETEWFGFYTPGQAVEIQSLQETKLYINDQLGLKQMDEENRLVFIRKDGDHLSFSDQWFIDNIIPYLE